MVHGWGAPPLRGVGGGGAGWARRRLRFGKQGMLMGFERQPLKVFKYFRRLVSKN